MYGPCSKRTMLAAALYLAAITYGASYQQYRFFDLDDAKGLKDTRDYALMAEGGACEVPATRRHRWVVPFLAGAVVRAEELVLPDTPDQDLSDSFRNRSERVELAFYAVNAAVIFGAGYLLFLFLLRLGFNPYLGLLGATMFLGSRIAIMSAATPLVDSVYFLAIVVIFYLSLADKLVLLALLNPVLILSKETIFPIMLLPLFSKKRLPLLGASLAVSLLALGASRYLVSSVCEAAAGAGAGDGLAEVLRLHGERGLHSLAHLMRPGSAHDLVNGFSFLVVLAGLGFVINRRQRLHEVPRHYLLLLPLALFYAFLSGNLGRMFFSSFVVVIPYALIGLEYIFTKQETRKKID